MANPDRIFHRHAKLYGLTLGEMLIVLAVFLILVGILWVSSRDVVVRTKHSRAIQDQRSISRALTAYEAETLRLPDEDNLVAITRPRTYIESLPEDPFAPKSNERLHKDYEFYRNISPRYKAVLVSVGPDGVSNVSTSMTVTRDNVRGRGGIQLNSFNSRFDFRMTDQEAEEFIAIMSYDPTNGTHSAGDIITVHQ